MIDFKGKSSKIIDDLEELVLDTFCREIEGCMLCFQLYQAIVNNHVEKGRETAIQLEESLEDSGDDNYKKFIAGIIKKSNKLEEYDFLNLL